VGTVEPESSSATGEGDQQSAAQPEDPTMLSRALRRRAVRDARLRAD
jgi:hypothetical protein